MGSEVTMCSSSYEISFRASWNLFVPCIPRDTGKEEKRWAPVDASNDRSFDSLAKGGEGTVDR